MPIQNGTLHYQRNWIVGFQKPTVFGFKNQTSHAFRVGWHATPIRVKVYKYIFKQKTAVKNILSSSYKARIEPLFNDLNDVISSNDNLINYKKRFVSIVTLFFSNTWI